MSTRHHFVEPLPYPSKGQRYIHTGRGGAGNCSILPPSNLTNKHNSHVNHQHHQPSLPALSSPRTVSFGRGGVGNMHTQTQPTSTPQHPRERAMFPLDEELEAQLRQARNTPMAPVYHVGRGGAGNISRSIGTSRIERKAVLYEPGEGIGIDEALVGGLRRRTSETESSASECSGRSEKSMESGADVVNGGLRNVGARMVGWARH